MLDNHIWETDPTCVSISINHRRNVIHNGYMGATVKHHSYGGVGICEVASQEEFLSAKVQRQRVALVSHLHLVAISKWHCGCLHQHMLQGRVHSLVVLADFGGLKNLDQRLCALVLLVC